VITPEDLERAPPFRWLSTAIDTAADAKGRLAPEVAEQIFNEFFERLAGWVETVAIEMAERLVQDFPGTDYKAAYIATRTALGGVQIEAKARLQALLRRAR
jgi:hypothetical protein